MRKWLLGLLFALAYTIDPAFAQNNTVVSTCGVLGQNYAVGSNRPSTITPDGLGCVSASVSASISGFTAATTGTPLSVTTASGAGSLPAGAVVVVSNAGATNTAYCQLGATATVASQPIPPLSWFAFTVGGSTQLACITSTSTTTVNMTGGAGIPTGAGGGGGGSGGGGGAVTIANGADAAEGSTTDAAATAGGTGTVSAKLRTMSGPVGPVAAGIAAANSQLGGGVYNSSAPTLTTGQQVATQMDASGNTKVVGQGTADNTPVGTIGGAGVMGLCATSPSAVTSGTLAYLSCNPTNRNLRIEGSGTAGSGSTAVVTVQGITNMTPFTTNPHTVASWGIQAAGSATPTNTNMMGINVASTARGWTGASLGSTYSGHVAVVDGSGNQVTSFGGSNASVSATGSALPASATYLGYGSGANIVGVTTAAPLPVTATGLADSVAIGAQTGSMVGCFAQTTVTAVSADDFAFLSCDPTTRSVAVQPYGGASTRLVGLITSSMTATTSTALTGMGTQGAGVRVYVTSCTFSNMHASVATEIVLQDGSGGATLWTAPASTNGGGAHTVFPNPLRTTADTGLFAANLTTGSSTKVSCTGYKAL